MRILQVHKYLYRKAGAEAYVLDLADLFMTHGHEVGLWGTAENAECRMKNVECFEDLLVEPLNFDRREGVWRDIKKFGHMLWSPESAWKFEQVLKRFHPDIVHIHNIYHHISPSILPMAREYNVPIVMTVHDYHLINPNYALYDHGKICECRGLSAIAHRCVKNSWVATTADVLEHSLHGMLHAYKRNVDRYLVPTEFVKKKLVEHGVDAHKVEVLPLFATKSLAFARGATQKLSFENYILYAGRLVVEKGIYLLLEIARRLPEIQFKIAGTGPEFKNVECRMKNEELRNVELLGFLEKGDLQKMLAGARLVVAPSLWYDLSPMAVLEAMAQGKVVAASRIGGIPELIEHGKTGFLMAFDYATLRSGNKKLFPELVEGWVDTIKKIYYDKKLLGRVGKAAQNYVRREHGGEQHYASLMRIYHSIK